MQFQALGAKRTKAEPIPPYAPRISLDLLRLSKETGGDPVRMAPILERFVACIEDPALEKRVMNTEPRPFKGVAPAPNEPMIGSLASLVYPDGGGRAKEFTRREPMELVYDVKMQQHLRAAIPAQPISAALSQVPALVVPVVEPITPIVPATIDADDDMWQEEFADLDEGCIDAPTAAPGSDTAPPSPAQVTADDDDDIPSPSPMEEDEDEDDIVDEDDDDDELVPGVDDDEDEEEEEDPNDPIFLKMTDKQARREERKMRRQHDKYEEIAPDPSLLDAPRGRRRAAPEDFKTGRIPDEEEDDSEEDADFEGNEEDSCSSSVVESSDSDESDEESESSDSSSDDDTPPPPVTKRASAPPAPSRKRVATPDPEPEPAESDDATEAMFNLIKTHCVGPAAPQSLLAKICSKAKLPSFSALNPTEQNAVALNNLYFASSQSDYARVASGFYEAMTTAPIGTYSETTLKLVGQLVNTKEYFRMTAEPLKARSSSQRCVLTSQIPEHVITVYYQRTLTKYNICSDALTTLEQLISLVRIERTVELAREQMVSADERALEIARGMASGRDSNGAELLRATALMNEGNAYECLRWTGK